MKQVDNYVFHDLFGIRLNSYRPFYGEFFRREFLGAEAMQPSGPPDIVVHIDSAEDRKKKSWQSSHRYHRLFNARWSVTGWDTETLEVHFASDWSYHVYPLVMAVYLETMILAPLFYWVGLKKGFLLIHGASAAQGGHGTVISAVGGSGKTTLTLRLVNRGFGFMGDDLTLISPDGSIMSYPRPLHLFSYVTNNLDFLKLSPQLKMIVRFKDVIRAVFSTLLRRRFMVATRVGFNEVMPGHAIVPRATADNLLLLIRDQRMIRLDLHDRAVFETTSDRLIQNGEINQILVDRLLPSNDHRVWARKREKELMDSFLGHVGMCYALDPRLVAVDQVQSTIAG